MDAKEAVVSKKEKTTSRMTAQQAIDLCRKYSDLALSDANKMFYMEIALLIERLQTCQTCEKQSNQFFGKCEVCEVMKDEP